MTYQIERMPAKDYYGRHATGIVVLVNGQPHHFTGPRPGQQAAEFIDGLLASDCKNLTTQP